MRLGQLYPSVSSSTACFKSSTISRGRACLVVQAARKSAKKTKPKQSRQSPEEFGDNDERLVPGSLTAPPPADKPITRDDEAASRYPVNLKDKQTLEASSGRQQWSWKDKEEEDKPLELQATWHPRTGFILPDDPQPAASQVDLLGAASPVANGDLPPASKGQILSASISTGGWMVILALIVRAYAQQNAARALGTDPTLLAELLSFPHLTASHAGIAAAAVGAVTLARVALLNAWPDFATATYQSNKQVLPSLGPMDVAIVSTVAGLSEELLFRGAFIPASFPDWRGVLLAGAVFGALHTGGGRNAAFAAWAGVVGCLYGAAYLWTRDMTVPILAHSFANMASAALFYPKYRRALEANAGDAAEQPQQRG